MVIVYLSVAMVAMLGFCSLAVDVGHCQLVKTELRRAADAVAIQCMVTYNNSSTETTTYTYNASTNPITMGNSNSPTFTISWGYWHPTTSTFNSTASGGTLACKVVVSCTQANGNPIPLTFGPVIGQSSIDMTASSIVTDSGNASANATVPSTANPYFAGMPSTTTNVYGDTNTASTNASIQITAIPVIPGSYLTFSSFTGTTSVVPGTMPYVGASGVSNYAYGTATQHNEDWDGSGSPDTENGIANAIMPESSLMGLFLGPDAPDTTAAPTTVVDWTTSANQTATTFTNLTTKAPFYIGNGQSTNGTVQKFQVPAGATRLYIAIWDGEQYNNNGGTLSGTIYSSQSISIVQ